MKNLLARFAGDEAGATAIEYGLIASLIALAVVTAATQMGDKLGTMFDNIKTNLK
jgi:pilus assembly protein Flp/PilA